MAAGLQVFNQFGGLELDLTDRVGRFLFQIVVGAGASGSVSNDGIAQGTPICFATMHRTDFTTAFDGDSLQPPSISFSGTTMSYSGVNTTTRLQVWVY